MMVVPAVDIRGGRCVRLLRGDPGQVTVYDSDPVRVGKLWAEKGARRIHVIDLDGAFSGRAQNLDLAGEIKRAAGCEVQFGGGLRDEETVRRALDLGLDKLIFGTAAIMNSDWVRARIASRPDRFMAALDVKAGVAAVEGWTEGSALSVEAALVKLESIGFGEVIFTDTDRDGTLGGPNLDSTRRVVEKTRMRVFASGGVSGMGDVLALEKIPGLAGVVIGKALYDGRVSLEACLKRA